MNLANKMCIRDRYLETKNPNDNKIEFKLGRKLATDKNLSF